MPEQSTGTALVAQLIAGWEALDVDAVVACFHEDGIWHNMPYPPIAGRAAIRMAVAGFIGDVVEVRFEVRSCIEASPSVVLTERIDVFRRKNGSELRFPVMGAFDISDGLIAEWRDYFDSAIMTLAERGTEAGWKGARQCRR